MARRDDAPRNLLVGLLALQNGMVSRDQLVAAFGAWTGSRDRDLADLLVLQNALDPAGRDLLEALAERHLRMHGGDPERSLAALEVGQTTRESLARAGGSDLEATVTRIGSGSTEPDSARTGTFQIGTVSAAGQRFRVLRPHARGGLGEVFVALDAELNREVALKQMLGRHAADPASRQRFLLEAEITGGLEHPGIVPVYGLGAHPDGQPYYAMRFISGDNLKDAASRFHADATLAADPSRRSLERRKLLLRFLDVCNAIGYAHSRGVLHRDIKPGNIIVGKHGETLVVDWGLAKPTGHSEPGADPSERTLMPASASGSAETLPGSALGTPAYMSPEQAAGKMDRLGPRSDVYSLGATLFFLLTGKPPFDGEVADVLQMVREGDFMPPRQYDLTIEPALEAICEKAMALRPEDRYATPKALAEDIERWMADEPVVARPDRGLEKLARWSRSHRSLTWSAAAALAVLAVCSTAAALIVNAARARESAARIEASKNFERANANYRLARQAVDDYLTRVSENTLLKFQPSRDLRELRKVLLEDALKFYRAFIDQRGGDPVLRRELGRSYARVGTITDEIGTKSAALAAHEKALVIRRELAQAGPGDASLRVDLAETLYAIGALRKSLGRMPDALAALDEARAGLEALVAAEPERRDALFLLGQICGFQGAVHKTSEQWEHAQALYDRARAIFARLAQLDAGEPKYVRNLAWSTYQIGNVLSHRRRKDLDLAGARTCYEAALKLQRNLISAHPGEPDYPIDMAQCYVSLADMTGREGDRPRALGYLEDALSLQKKVVASHPSVTLYLMDLSDTCFNLGYMSSQLGRPDDSLRWYQEAIDAAERLAELDPENIDFQDSLGQAINNHGSRLLETGETDLALADFVRAIDIHHRVLAKAPAAPGHRSVLLHPLLNVARVKILQGKPAEAVAAALEARSLAKGFPDALGDIAARLANAGGLAAEGSPERARDLDLAMDVLRDALASGETKPGEVAPDPDFAALGRRKDFQALILDPLIPADPFAHP